MRKFLTVVFSLFLLTACARQEADRVVVAYVTSWTNIMPDPMLMTHINYAFGHVTDSFDGVRVDNEQRLRAIVALKQQNPDLKVLLSIGGWGSGRFSEMAASSDNRSAFAQDCRRVVEEFGLDGIDIDWEYPTNGGAGISSSPADTENFTLLMRDIRKAIGKKKLLTIATVASGAYIDFKACIDYLDFVNTMTYDMANPPFHHSAMRESSISGGMTVTCAIENHLAAGVPRQKLVMGMPFYGRGGQGNQLLRSYVRTGFTGSDYHVCWNDTAQVPYLADGDGRLVLGFDNPRSLALKCQYILDMGLRGGMYWDYESDNAQHDEARTVWLSLLKLGKGTPAPRRVLVLAERGGDHEGFTATALEWLESKKEEMNLELTIVNDAKELQAGDVSRHNLVLQLNYPPYAWSEAGQREFEQYVDECRGAYIGFHHATLLGDFDGYPLWQWFANFMGGVKFESYIPQLADGTVQVEDTTHPVMAGVPKTFVLPKDEWYTYNNNPRAHVRVLAHVDEASYVDKDCAPQWGPQSYRPMPTMGDHPVIWTNPTKKARNVYFQFGHHKELFQTDAFVTLLTNAINWTLARD